MELDDTAPAYEEVHPEQAHVSVRQDVVNQSASKFFEALKTGSEMVSSSNSTSEGSRASSIPRHSSRWRGRQDVCAPVPIKKSVACLLHP